MKIGVITVARSDYGHYLPVIRALNEENGIDLRLIVSGTHLSPEYGMTVNDIKKESFIIDHQIEMILSSGSPEGVVKSMGVGLIGFAQSYSISKYDMLIVLGDRFEMLTATIAALPFGIPVVHLYGGAVTEGNIDDAIRHSITKMSHYHIVSTEKYARRIIQMGEESSRVFVVGAPTLDNITQIKCLHSEEIEKIFHLKIPENFLLVTFHPVTLYYEMTRKYFKSCLNALKKMDMPVIFTMPNADTSGHEIRLMIKDYVKENTNSQMVESMGTEGYFSLMALAKAMVGNSSSGLVEAPSFYLPVVNIGDRQKGKIKCENVIDVGYTSEDILSGIRKAVSEEFSKSIRHIKNKYGDGKASERIVDIIKNIKLENNSCVKSFVDHSFSSDFKVNNLIC